jgi:hypothetical protein
MHELGLQNEFVQYHCIIHHQKLIIKALQYKQIMIDIISEVKFIRLSGKTTESSECSFDKIKSDCSDIV